MPGARLVEYIRAAGGLAADGTIHHVYVTQPDGRVQSVVARRFRPDTHPVPLAGSTVQVVPQKTVDHTDNIARLGVVAQILGGLVALVAVTRR